MSKIKAFIIAIIIFIVIVVGYNATINYQIKMNKSKLYYQMDDAKYNSVEGAKACLDDNTILLLGSSELATFNSSVFNNGNSNFNVYIIGRGKTQCLQSAITIGAIEEETNIKKAVLILSPQWFEGKQGIGSTAFASRFQKNIFQFFMKNNKISYETKQNVINLLKKLEVTDKLELEKIKRYENAYLNFDIVERVSLAISDSIENTKQNKKLLDILNDVNSNTNTNMLKFEENNFEDLLEEARVQGEKYCTNNDFIIEDTYYNTYIEPSLETYKDSYVKTDFANNEEYQHLELFLKICNELGIQPLIINVPVNGRWYDYIGMSKEKREAYYEKIKNITADYGAKIADFSDCEYEDYFLKDIMHLGWRGWIKVDEAIYKYYNEK